MTEPDRFAVVKALTAAAKAHGWRPAQVESSEALITFVVLAPLAQPRSERNRWPDEPEEGEEPDFDPDEVYKEQNKVAEEFDSDDRSARGDSGWSTKIVRGDPT